MGYGSTVEFHLLLTMKHLRNISPTFSRHPGLLLAVAASLFLAESRPTALAQVANDPIALWAFDEASGTTALDSSGNNHAGTIVGATYVTGRSNTA